MSASNEWEVFDIDRIESAFVAIVNAAINSPGRPVQVLGKYSTQEENTPRVFLVLTTREANGHRHLLNLPFSETRMQPYDAWMFNLAATITTQRESNGVLHRQLVAETRLALQFYKLVAAWASVDALAPYHTVIDIGELASSELSVDDANTLDSTTLNFSGQLCIDPAAWPRQATDPTPTAIPLNLTLPTITGPNPPKVGDTLTAHPGTYSNGPYTTAHEWVNAPGPVQTGETILIENDEWIGVNLFVREIATNVIGPSEPAESASYPAVEPA